MEDFIGNDVNVRAVGTVRSWNAEEGWGVIDAPGAPGGCWTHVSHLDMSGFRSLKAGQEVDLEFDDRGQDGFPFRAVRVIVPGTPRANPQFSTGTSGSYRSTVGLRFDQQSPK